MGEGTSKTTCRSNNKTWVHTRHFSQRRPVANRWQRHSPVAGLQMEKGKLPAGLQLQAVGRETRGYLCVAAAGLTLALDVASVWWAVFLLQADALQMDMAWHPAALRLPPQWGLSLGRAGALVEGQCGGLPCADLHCAALACCWVPYGGYNVLTNPPCAWVGAGWVFQWALLRGTAVWKPSWQISSSCHLDAGPCSAESTYPNSDSWDSLCGFSFALTQILILKIFSGVSISLFN